MNSFPQIYDLETKYLAAEYSHAGTVLKVREWMIAEKAKRSRRKEEEKEEKTFFSFSVVPFFFLNQPPPAPPRLHSLQGLDGFLSSKDALKKRAGRGFKVEDRLFSLSSIGSPATAEAEAAAAGGGGRSGNNNDDDDDSNRNRYGKVYNTKGSSFASKGRRGSGI